MSAPHQTVRELVTTIVDAYNAKDADAVAALYHPDARYWSPLGDWQEGLEAIRTHIEELHRLLPDEQMSVTSLIAGDDIAVVEFRSTGTAPSGSSYQLDFTEVLELREGKIATVKVYLDPEEVDRIMA